MHLLHPLNLRDGSSAAGAGRNHDSSCWAAQDKNERSCRLARSRTVLRRKWKATDALVRRESVGTSVGPLVWFWHSPDRSGTSHFVFRALPLCLCSPLDCSSVVAHLTIEILCVYRALDALALISTGIASLPSRLFPLFSLAALENMFFFSLSYFLFVWYE